MHEHALARGIVRQVLAGLPQPAPTVTAVHVRMGALAGERPEALRAAFAVAAEGSALAGAALRIDEADDALIAVELVACTVLAPPEGSDDAAAPAATGQPPPAP
jgi:hydrogenase nickel incorporation protein HypA/HybF